MGVLLQICCIFPEHVFLGTPLGGCFFLSKTDEVKCLGYLDLQSAKFFKSFSFVQTAQTTETKVNKIRVQSSAKGCTDDRLDR